MTFNIVGLSLALLILALSACATPEAEQHARRSTVQAQNDTNPLIVSSDRSFVDVVKSNETLFSARRSSSDANALRRVTHKNATKKNVEMMLWFTWNDALKNFAAGIVAYKSPYGNMMAAAVNTFWPSSSPDIWSQIEDQVKEVVDEAILKRQMEDVAGDLAGIEKGYKDYTLALENEKAHTLKALILDTLAVYERFMASSNRHHFAGSALTVSYLHLTVLRERVQYGEDFFEEDNYDVWISELNDAVEEHAEDFAEIPALWRQWRETTLTFEDDQGNWDVTTNKKPYVKDGQSGYRKVATSCHVTWNEAWDGDTVEHCRSELNEIKNAWLDELYAEYEPILDRVEDLPVFAFTEEDRRRVTNDKLSGLHIGLIVGGTILGLILIGVGACLCVKFSRQSGGIQGPPNRVACWTFASKPPAYKERHTPTPRNAGNLDACAVVF